MIFFPIKCFGGSRYWYANLSPLSLSFLEIQRALDPFEITINSSQGIIFVILVSEGRPLSIDTKILSNPGSILKFEWGVRTPAGKLRSEEQVKCRILVRIPLQ